MKYRIVVHIKKHRTWQERSYSVEVMTDISFNWFELVPQYSDLKSLGETAKIFFGLDITGLPQVEVEEK